MERANERVPPHSLDAERAVLGGLLLQNSAIDVVLEIIKVDDFYSEANARIFESALTLHRSSTPVDTITLRDALERGHMLVGVGGHDYLLSLTDTKGRRIVVPADKLAYVEIGSPSVGQVGFRS